LVALFLPDLEAGILHQIAGHEQARASAVKAMTLGQTMAYFLGQAKVVLVCLCLLKGCL
jgi:hypothetical protein